VAASLRSRGYHLPGPGDLAHERQVQDQLNNDARIALVAGQWLLAGDLAEGAQQAGSDVDALQEKLDALQLQLDDLKQLITPNSELLNSATDSYINLYGQLDTDIVTYDITDNCK